MNELSVIIPCLYSVEMLPDFLDDLAASLMSNPSDVDIILVANGGVSGIGHIIHHVHKNYPWLKFEVFQRKDNSKSYGALARLGLAYSTSRYAVLVSPYKEDDIHLIFSMLNKIRTGCQVVQATRYAHPDKTKRIPLRFRLYQSVYRFLTRVLLGFEVSDSTYAFKMFDRLFIQALGLTQNGYSICPEIVLKTLLMGGKVEYITSKFETAAINKDFKLWREGFGYFWLFLSAFGHRIGIRWF